MHRYAPFFLIGLSGTLLAGCSSTGGGGAGGGGGGGTPSPALFAASAGTASEALADGETLMAYNSLMSAAVEHDFDAGETRALDGTTFSIAANDQGGLDVIIDGVAYSFTDADISGNAFEFDDPGGMGPYYRLNSWDGDIVDVLDVSNTAHHQVWSYFWDPAGEPISGFAVVGTETMPEALEGKANATYSGAAGAALTDSGTFNDTTRIVGELAMSADFNAGQISGLVDNIAVIGLGACSGGVGPACVNGTAALDSAAITGTGFSGTITADSDLLTAFSLTDLGGTYSGKFYGADGEEVGGVMALSGEETVGTGYFSATQD
ncbi:transferrin-binding protein-like solute binding protein [Pelagibacterium halotolerans]|uniref:Transferrin-binding protein B C-lobe/N-lobe beta-barrel domain-containing protein n=1 Tax=Pelagibacterium halotolerans (strain DSM 22347 / JCM 15775 / CGMCC 1.7692 / B2) TaxID=1082931 RepID=G4RF33_PELHB|nr:transferrin-binding protein-like solute binding protein [Pelagibacterium halotolerans]AEQ52966.1 hypothetical protein KKY_2972 [Pelagibacterium halotolerans B2]QJR17373.1 hypothetical protein HKM20_02205 [Pelagibacterium halotolerans]SEA97447.1 hypothetical protein SAMN05428936_1166 [Pelagibacterium halotolerans]